MGPENRSISAPPRRRRRQLNIPRIKAVLVLIVATITAFGSGLTGLGAPVAFAPMLSWMLGFSAEKAQATAIRFAAFAAAAAVLSVFMAQSLPGSSSAASTAILPPAFLWEGVLLFVGATLGAVLAGPFAKRSAVFGWRQLCQTLGVGITLYVIIETSHRTLLNAPPHHSVSSPLLLLLGLVVGALTQTMGLTSGVLLVPALYYFAGFTANVSVALSLLVVALASILPAWSYAQRGLMDTTYSVPTILGGILGGFLGGLLLAHLPEKGVLYLFAVIAMFLSGRELARISWERSTHAA